MSPSRLSLRNAGRNRSEISDEISSNSLPIPLTTLWTNLHSHVQLFFPGATWNMLDTEKARDDSIDAIDFIFLMCDLCDLEFHNLKIAKDIVNNICYDCLGLLCTGSCYLSAYRHYAIQKSDQTIYRERSTTRSEFVMHCIHSICLQLSDRMGSSGRLNSFHLLAALEP